MIELLLYLLVGSLLTVAIGALVMLSPTFAAGVVCIALGAALIWRRR